SREERRRGLPSHEALERTARTSGRTVLVSGTTVAIAMAGMFAIRSAVFNGIASGTITVVACAVAGSLTVLPAVLELLGAPIHRGRLPFLPHLRTDGTVSPFWPRIVDAVLRRPVVSCVLAAGVLVALAVPALRMHVSKPSNDALASRSDPTLASFAHIRERFPSTAAPALLARASAAHRGPPPPRGSPAAPRGAAPPRRSRRAAPTTAGPARSSFRSPVQATTQRAVAESRSCALRSCRRRSAGCRTCRRL